MKKILLFLALFILYTTAPFAQAEHWTPLSSTETSSCFFNSETIQVRESGVNPGRIYVDVRIKVKHTDLGKMRYIDSLKNNGISTAHYERLSFSVYHILFGDGEIAVLTINDYSDSGAQIRQTDTQNPKWEEIAAGSSVEGWYHSILEYTSINMQRIVNQDIQI